jgi:lipopolysaccharide transport system ATP-binding protein
MRDTAIRVENLGKLYQIGHRLTRYETLRDRIALFARSPFRHLKYFGTRLQKRDTDFIWAIKDVSFEVRRGEIVGIIGRNGAGKSTLLKILSRITEPTEGYAEIHGRLGSLLEVGTGFHPELTGRENIYLNGAILGMRKAEIDRKFDEIVAFAEIEKFLDTPVKRYSSGMYVRLAFAVAAHLEPEILLVDEVLAVGDAAFQKKCLGKMGDVAKEGRTVLFVSHNMRAITDLCQRCLWINNGKIIQEGAPQQVVLAYLSSGQPERLDGVITPDMHINATGDVYFRRVALLDRANEPVTTFFFGEPLRILMEYEVCRPVEGMRLIVAIEKLDGTLVSVLHHTDDPHAYLIDAEPGTYSASMEVALPLMPGGYSIHLAAKPAPGFWGSGKSWDWVQRALDFYVKEFSKDGDGILPAGGVVRPSAKWDIRRIDRVRA